MSSEERPGARPPLSDRSVELLGDQIAAKREHVGGGSAAAAAASLAAATAELVVSLSIRRSTPPALASDLQGKAERLGAIRQDLMLAGDNDERALDNLMLAYRSRSADQGPLLEAAARSTLDIAGLATQVVEISAAAVEHASRFTASDLGAAATIAHGAVLAALMTARVNVYLLEETEDSPADAIQKLRDEISRLEQASTKASGIAESRTLARLGQGSRGSA